MSHADQFPTFVVGLLFRDAPSYRESKRVLMTVKTHPSWQVGLLNGVGGLVEDETAEQAMWREGEEEAKIRGQDLKWPWEHFLFERGPEYHLHYFRAMASAQYRPPVGNDAGELLGWVNTDFSGISQHTPVGSLRWVVPLAQDWRRMSLAVVVEDDIRRIPTW